MSSTESEVNETPAPPAPQQTVNLDSLNVVQSLNILWSMLNQASNKGAFSIDESYVLKVIFQKITAGLSHPATEEADTETNVDV